jgi:sporulation protein YlmC with PRC-barrel domain
MKMHTRAKYRTRSLFLSIFLVALFLATNSFAASSEVSARHWRVSRLVDQVVRDEKGNEVGEVENLVIRRNGTLKRVLIALDGFLELEEKIVAVPFRRLQISADTNITVVDSKEQLEKLTDFNHKKEDVFTGFYRRAPRGGYYSGDYNYYPSHYLPWAWASYPDKMLATVIIGQKVYGDEGKKIGEIDDLMLTEGGKVDQIILSSGGFLEIDEKLVAIPYKPLGFSEFGVVYPITIKQLNSLPEFKYQE